MKKIGNFIKENWIFIIVILGIVVLFNYHLPYYVDTGGGTIEINDRIECDKCREINGSLNLLYVSEYEANIPMYLLSFVMPNWEVEKISEQQINNETAKDIYTRNRLMLDNSVDSALYVAYEASGNKIDVVDKKNMVIATTKNNGLKIGDEILEINGVAIDNFKIIKDMINDSEVGQKLEFKIVRDKKQKNIKVKVMEEDKEKLIGAVIITDYEYKLSPKIDLKFRDSESGSSGGLMLALSIYSRISDNDIVKGRKIAGTGTIDMEGNVGEIAGIKYKIMGANAEGVDVVLVPKDNYKEAIDFKKKNNYDLDIVKVETFEDALNYLKSSN